MSKILRKVPLAAAAAVGFFAGSRSGRKPYETLEQRLHQLRNRSGVSDATSAVRETPSGAAGSLTADELVDEQGRESFPASDPPAH